MSSRRRHRIAAAGFAAILSASSPVRSWASDALAEPASSPTLAEPASSPALAEPANSPEPLATASGALAGPASPAPLPAAAAGPSSPSAAGAPGAPFSPPIYLLDRLAAGASVGYFTSDRAKILSEIHFDFPFLVFRQKSLYSRASLETVTVKTGDRLSANSFRAQGVEYLFEVGARDYLSNRVAIAAFAGKQGRRALDGAGSNSILYAGVGFESIGFPRPGGGDRFEWRLAIGPTFSEEDVASSAILRGSFLYDLWRGSRSSVGIDGSFDSLFDATQGLTEYRVGPRWTVPLSNGIRANLFAEWIRSRNPLRLDGSQGWTFGFRYDEGAYSGPHTMELPDIRGVLLASAAVDHRIERFDLDLSSPELQLANLPTRVYANLDANLRSGETIDTLWYIATAGLDLALTERLVVGPSISHRSNHAIGKGRTADPTNLNLVRLGVRTRGWEYADRLPGRLMPEEATTWLDRIDASFVPGVLTSSRDGHSTSWDLQSGVRVDLSDRSRNLVPFIRAFGEWGDVDRRELGVGVASQRNLVLEIRYAKDSQYFGQDKDDLLLAASLVF